MSDGFKRNVGIRLRVQWSTELFRLRPSFSWQPWMKYFHWLGFSIWVEWWNHPMPSSYTTTMEKIHD